MDSDAYLKMLISNGAFLRAIDQPTRATNSSSLIIDHIITNGDNNILYRCIIRGGLTDRFSVACFVANDSRNHYVSRNFEQPFFILDTRRFDHDLYSDDLNGSSKNCCIEFGIVVTSCNGRHLPLRLASRRKREQIKKKRRFTKKLLLQFDERKNFMSLTSQWI